MTDKELLQQALDALKHLCLHTSAIKGYDGHKVQPAIKAIKARLAQPEPEQVKYNVNGATVYIKPPLYTAQPKKEWVGLTDGDVNYCVDAIYKGFDMKPKNEIEIEYFERVIKFVEAKLKEKNT